MYLFLIEIPIENYDCDGLIDETLYIQSHHPVFPTKLQILNVLKDLDAKDSEYPTYLGNWKECIAVIESI